MSRSRRSGIPDMVSSFASAGISGSTDADSYTINDRTFPNKLAAVREVQRILHGGSVANPKNQRLIQDLLAQHPEADVKRGPAFQHIQIVTSDEGPNAFAAVQADGSHIIFSFKKCFGYVKSKEEKLAEAARHAVEDQLLSFKLQGDHQSSSFTATHAERMSLQKLLAGWMQVADLSIDNVHVDDLNPGSFPKFCMTQRNQLIPWREYHQEHAVLDVITCGEYERHRKTAYV